MPGLRVREYEPLFFTGGSALRNIALELARNGSGSTHIITTFDSGGSSRALREAFAIPAVGDIRNRLLALANPYKTDSHLIGFLASRLPVNISFSTAHNLLKEMGKFSNPCWASIPAQDAKRLFEIFEYFLANMPESFDGRGASIGNIILTSLYLAHKRELDPAIAFLKNLLNINGNIIPVTDANLTLAADLANGGRIYGQHHFKELRAPVKRIFLTVHSKHYLNDECLPPINKEAKENIGAAKIICYPMGSFYSSVVANLLPKGVGRAIASSKAVKIFIPNTGVDPEAMDLSVPQQAATIMNYLRLDAPLASPDELLHYVLVDLENGIYGPGWQDGWGIELERMGIKILARRIVREVNRAQHDPGPTLNAIYELGTKK